MTGGGSGNEWGALEIHDDGSATIRVGTSSHVFGEMLARQSGVPMVHVPYKGAGDAAKDLLAGRVPLMFDSASSALPLVKSGRLRALGVVAERRSPFMPDVPTFAEQGYRGIDLVGWLGFFGPPQMPPDVVRTLNAAIVRALSSSELRDAFAGFAYETASSSPRATPIPSWACSPGWTPRTAMCS